MDEPTAPVRTVATWLPVTGGGWVRRRTAGLVKGRVSTARYHKRPRRIAQPASKTRWLWRRRHHTTYPWVWRSGLLNDAPAVRAMINEQLLQGLTGI